LHDVLFDGKDANDILCSDVQRPSFLFGMILREPEMYDPTSNDDIRSPRPGPLLCLQLGEQLLADYVVVCIRARERLTLDRRQCPHEVRPADDAHQLAIAYHRHPLDPFGFEEVSDFSELGLSYRRILVTA
jgi:hypothetical protein